MSDLIQISSINTIETSLWSAVYAEFIRAALGQKWTPLETTAPEMIAAEAADRAVLALRKRYYTNTSRGPITLEDTIEGAPKFG
jgi:hypothetical protein